MAQAEMGLGLEALFQLCGEARLAYSEGLASPVQAWQVLRPSIVESRFEALRGSALTRLVPAATPTSATIGRVSCV